MVQSLRISLRILFTGASFTRPFDPQSIGGLSKAARLSGHELCRDINDMPDLLVCLDYHPRFNQELRRARALGVPRLLIKQEPPAIIPQHRHANPRNYFDGVITRGSSGQSPAFNCSLSWDVRYVDEPKRTDRVVAISADKWSFVPSELYSLRLRTYSEDSRIDVYGRDWGRPLTERIIGLCKAFYVAVSSFTIPKLSNLAFAFRTPINSLGPVDEKARLLSGYKVSLVIENDMSSMSEKLVDSILAGTIPVYVGPQAGLFGIPKDLVIQCSAEVPAIRQALTLALTWDSKEYRRRAELWAENEGSKLNWKPEEVDARLVSYIIKWHTRHIARSD